MIRTRGACTAAQVPFPRTPSSGPSPQSKMFSPSESARTFTSAGSPSDIVSTRRFIPAGSEDAVTVHNLDVEAERDWKMNYKYSDALVIGHDENRRVLVDFMNYTEVSTGRMVSLQFL